MLLVSILGMQETKWVGEKVRIIEPWGYKLWYTSKDRNRNGVVLCRRQQPHRGTLDLQSTEEQYHDQHKQNNPEKEHKDTNLTRFGLVAYVLGARKGEGFY